MCLLIEGLGGLDRIEALQLHENHQVALTALNIIERHFSEVSAQTSCAGDHLAGTWAVPRKLPDPLFLTDACPTSSGVESHSCFFVIFPYLPLWGRERKGV